MAKSIITIEVKDIEQAQLDNALDMWLSSGMLEEDLFDALCAESDESYSPLPLEDAITITTAPAGEE